MTAGYKALSYHISRSSLRCTETHLETDSQTQNHPIPDFHRLRLLYQSSIHSVTSRKSRSSSSVSPRLPQRRQLHQCLPVGPGFLSTWRITGTVERISCLRQEPSAGMMSLCISYSHISRKLWRRNRTKIDPLVWNC